MAAQLELAPALPSRIDMSFFFAGFSGLSP
jgi:hypothetical protein